MYIATVHSLGDIGCTAAEEGAGKSDIDSPPAVAAQVHLWATSHTGADMKQEEAEEGTVMSIAEVHTWYCTLAATAADTVPGAAEVVHTSAAEAASKLAVVAASTWDVAVRAGYPEAEAVDVEEGSEQTALGRTGNHSRYYQT